MYTGGRVPCDHGGVASERVERVQGLRRSNAARPHRNRARYTRVGLFWRDLWGDLDDPEFREEYEDEVDVGRRSGPPHV